MIVFLFGIVIGAAAGFAFVRYAWPRILEWIDDAGDNE